VRGGFQADCRASPVAAAVLACDPEMDLALIQELAQGVPGALALMVFATATPFPAEIAALAVAMRYGIWPALALIWVGAMGGALAGYGLARWLGQRLTRFGAVRRAEARLRDLGWLGILGLRLVPLVPFFAISLAAGLLRVPLRAYLAGTALGILPGCVVMTLIGRGLISRETRVVIGAALLAAAVLVLLAALKWRDARRRKAQPSG
jgi:uncharacterized membrane protein YdjX (TVP38/TMEM64 family)